MRIIESSHGVRSTKNWASQCQPWGVTSHWPAQAKRKSCSRRTVDSSPKIGSIWSGVTWCKRKSLLLLIEWQRSFRGDLGMLSSPEREGESSANPVRIAHVHVLSLRVVRFFRCFTISSESNSSLNGFSQHAVECVSVGRQIPGEDIQGLDTQNGITFSRN